MKPSFKYVSIALLFIAAYFISLSFQHAKKVEKEIAYNNPNASEVYFVWGLVSGDIPPKENWPVNSYIKDPLIYSKLNNLKDTFYTSISLPAGTAIYYWMLHTKDKSGNPTEYWDAGGGDRGSYLLTFDDDGFLKPGYFIFLAGFLPLLLFYFSHRNTQTAGTVTGRYTVRDYVPQFDSIRAIAVMLVIFHHWLPEKSWINFLPNGPLGVNIFFVLSGFLITSILLKAKNQLDGNQAGKGSVFKRFYIRRTLRIFPIYYLLLFILLALKDPPIMQDGIYYFTYTSNILFYNQQFFPAHVAHLWSLAVEEQFYLVWPWLIVLVNRKLLPYVMGLFLIIGISSNFIITSKDWWVTIFTPACFDAFAIGGLLSYLITYRQDIVERLQPKFKIICVAVGLLFLLDVLKYAFLPARTTQALLASTVIYYCLFKNNNKVPNYILKNRWLQQLGKISYGVYLYHLFVPQLWLWINDKLYKWGVDPFFNKSVPAAAKPYWLFVQEFALLLLLCILSWQLIEKPINSLKSRFDYKKKSKETELQKVEMEPHVVIP